VGLLKRRFPNPFLKITWLFNFACTLATACLVVLTYVTEKKAMKYHWWLEVTRFHKMMITLLINATISTDSVVFIFEF